MSLHRRPHSTTQQLLHPQHGGRELDRDAHNEQYQLADGRQLRDYDIRYEERELVANQIRGHHVIGARHAQNASSSLDRDLLDGLTFDWYLSDSTAETDIPSEIKFSAEDTVDPATGELLQTALRRSNSAADYRFTDLEDEVDSSGWDLLKPYTFDRRRRRVQRRPGRLATRRAATRRHNSASARRRLAAHVDPGGTPDQVFTDANILNPANGFMLSVGGIGTESYLAAQTRRRGVLEGRRAGQRAVASGRRRALGGVPPGRRCRSTRSSTASSRASARCAVRRRGARARSFDEDDVYPALAATRIIARRLGRRLPVALGLSETVARPDLREVSASTLHRSADRDARFAAIRSSKRSPITNVDLRAEWFFGNGDNFTASLFYKDIEQPIETVQGAGTDDNISLTFINAESASVYGLEIEWLKDLSTFGSGLPRSVFLLGQHHAQRLRADRGAVTTT